MVFSDECPFSLDPHVNKKNDVVWLTPNQDKDPEMLKKLQVPRSKRTCTVHVWGAMTGLNLFFFCLLY